MNYLIGIGTYTAWDDSIGLRIAETLAETERDEAAGFRAIDLGGTLLDVLGYLDGAEKLLVVDTALMGEEPGTYRFFKPGEVVDRKQLEGASTHEGNLMSVLRLAQSMGTSIDPVTIMGIQPESSRVGTGLSAALEQNLSEYLNAAVQFMRA